MSEVLEKVYESTNSTVFRKTEADGKYSVIKVLKIAQAHPRSILQFNNEYAFLSELNIPGVTKVCAKELIQG